MGYFFEISDSLREAINETNSLEEYQNNGGYISKEIKSKLIGLVMKKMKGKCNPKIVNDFIEMEFSI